jgi:hypothetical protein
MELLGPNGLFYFLGAISLLLGLIGLKRPNETQSAKCETENLE